MMEQVDLLNKTFCVSEFKDTYTTLYHAVIVNLLVSETENLSREQLKNLIVKHGGELEIAAQLMILYYSKGESPEDKKEAVSLFVKLVNDSKSFNLNKTALEILKYFSGIDKGNELIFQEYKYKLEVEKNKVQFFTAYWTALGNGFEGYKKKYYGKALESYLVLIKDKNNYSSVCYQLLEGFKEKDFEVSQEVIQEIVVASEKMIQIGSPTLEQNEIIFNVSQAKEKWGILISPDILSCINLGSMLDGLKDPEEIKKVVYESNIDLRNMDYTRYEEWLFWCLPNVKHIATTWKIHGAIVKAFCSDNLKNIFFTTYIGSLGEELSKNDTKWIQIFGEFMLYFMSNKNKLGEEVYIQARSNVVNVLSRCTNSQVVELDEVIITGYMEMIDRQEVAIEWINLQKKFTPSKQEKGFFSSFFKK